MNENYLFQKYVNEKVSANKIAKEFGVHHTAIVRILKRLGVTMRTQSESMKGTRQSNDHKEKRMRSLSANYRGSKHHAWRGGKSKTREGYVYEKSYYHPHRNENNAVLEHRLVMEGHLRRLLLPSEVVHHINEIKDDNRLENLHLFRSSKDHSHYHNMKRVGIEMELKYEYE
jgi:transposase